MEVADQMREQMEQQQLVCHGKAVVRREEVVDRSLRSKKNHKRNLSSKAMVSQRRLVFDQLYV